MAEEERDTLRDAIMGMESYAHESWAAIPEANSISGDEYEQWFPVRRAVEYLAPALGHANTAKREIWAYLQGGGLVGVARQARWERDFGGFDARPYNKLFWLLWKLNKQPEHYDAFWATGRTTLQGIDDRRRGFVVECDAVRLDPLGLKLILSDTGHNAPSSPGEDLPTPATALRRQDLPVVPEPIAQAFVAWAMGRPDASKEAAEKAAIHMFPNHNLSRQRIRDLWGAGKMGRPSKDT